jgi:hypothetical protein
MKLGQLQILATTLVISGCGNTASDPAMASGSGGEMSATGAVGGGGGGAEPSAGGASGAVGDAGAGGVAPVEGCTGCLRFSKAMDDPSDWADAHMFVPATDLSGSTISVRVMVVDGGTSGGFQVLAVNGVDQGYTNYFDWTNLADLSPKTGTWNDVIFDVANIADDPLADPNFDPTKVVEFGFALNASAETTSSHPVVYVDEITASDGAIGPFTFDSADAADTMAFSIGGQPEGAELTWVGP